MAFVELHGGAWLPRYKVTPGERKGLFTPDWVQRLQGHPYVPLCNVRCNGFYLTYFIPYKTWKSGYKYFFRRPVNRENRCCRAWREGLPLARRFRAKCRDWLAGAARRALAPGFRRIKMRVESGSRAPEPPFVELNVALQRRFLCFAQTWLPDSWHS